MYSKKEVAELFMELKESNERYAHNPIIEEFLIEKGLVEEKEEENFSEVGLTVDECIKSLTDLKKLL